MALEIIARLHGELLRDVSGYSHTHYSGLRSGAADLRRRMIISNQLAKRLTRLDDAFAVVRHITDVSAIELRAQLSAALAAFPSSSDPSTATASTVASAPAATAPSGSTAAAALTSEVSMAAPSLAPTTTPTASRAPIVQQVVEHVVEVPAPMPQEEIVHVHKIIQQECDEKQQIPEALGCGACAVLADMRSRGLQPVVAECPLCWRRQRHKGMVGSNSVDRSQLASSSRATSTTRR